MRGIVAKIEGIRQATDMRMVVSIVCCLLAIVVDVHSPSLADVLQLKTGGRVEGELLNPDQSPRTTYIMRLETGGQMTVQADQVAKYESITSLEQRYQRLLDAMPTTADGNWRLAEWCRKQRLREHRETHLQATIGLDPNHERARAALGFALVDDEWLTRDQRMGRLGYVRYEGRWRLPQDVEIIQQREQRDLAVKKWKNDIKQWRSWFGKKNEMDAREHLSQIDDVLAAAPLAEQLAKEPYPNIQSIYVAALGKLDSPVATAALIRMALGDCTDEIRDQCLVQLDASAGGRDVAIDAFINALRSNDNVVVRRAAFGLTQISDERAIRPLIDSLVTEHKVIRSTGQPGQISTSFGGSSVGGSSNGSSSNGGQSGGGLSVGGGGSKTERRLVKNAAVLAALTKLSGGANFLYDQAAWRQWYIEQTTPSSIDLRRGA